MAHVILVLAVSWGADTALTRLHELLGVDSISPMTE